MNYFNSYKGLEYINQEEGKKLKFFLKELGLSSRFVRQAIEEENIYVNEEKTFKNISLKKDDKVFIAFLEEKLNAHAQDKELDIVYEDQDFLVVNKEPYMVTHTAKDDLKDTLLNYLAGYFLKNNIKRKVRFVNRLDRDTSGLVIVAKNKFAHNKIQDQFGESVEKKYLAIVEGKPEKANGIIEAPIGLGQDGIRREISQDGKYSKSEYRLLKTNNRVSLLEVRIYTGRTHQIRVHLNYIGHPIIGDDLYFKKSPIINRQALHAYYMKLKRPRDDKIIELKAKMPDDMKKIIDIKNI